MRIDNRLYDLATFEAGLVCADIDHGSATGTPNAGITIDDPRESIVRFESGRGSPSQETRHP